MKAIFNWLGRVISVPLAALVGNWLGGELRFLVTGDRLQTIQYRYTTKKGNTIANAPVATKLYPGMMFAILGQPRWFFALIGGLLTGGLVPDEWEHYWVERVIEPLIVERVLRE